MRNSHLEDWLDDSSYFSALAVLSQGPLHPGGMVPNGLLASRLNWSDVQVLDLGAGTGLSHRFYTALGAHVVSVEPNAWMRRAAVKAGVAPSEIHAIAAEDISGSWLNERFDNARLVVQGVTGFLPNGLDTLIPILAHSSISEVVLVEWVCARTNYGSAPVRNAYCATDYLAAVEQAGFRSLSLETFSYNAPDNALREDEAESRVRWHFNEANEMNWIGALPLKLSTIRLPSTTAKDYLILIARRLHT